MIYVRVRTVGTSVLFVVEQSVSVFSGQQPIVEIFGHRIALRRTYVGQLIGFVHPLGTFGSCSSYYERLSRSGDTSALAGHDFDEIVVDFAAFYFSYEIFRVSQAAYDSDGNSLFSFFSVRQITRSRVRPVLLRL